MIANNLGPSIAELAWEEGEAEGRAKGEAEGRAKGEAEGRAKGEAEGRAKGLAEGRAKGLAEGRTEGKTEGRTEGEISTCRDMLKTLLLTKFQSLPKQLIQQIDAVGDLSRLKDAFQRAAICEKLDEFQL